MACFIFLFWSFHFGRRRVFGLSTANRRLDELLSKLPDDGGHLPPNGRRLVIQTPEADRFRARVYDLADAPEEVLRSFA